MEITDFSKGQVWGIMPDKIDVIFKKFMDYEVSNVDASNFMERTDSQVDYDVIDGVAIIPISGTITKEASLFSFLFGGIAVSDIVDMFNMAMSDPAVKAIVLSFDSPGGTIGGIDSLAEGIFSARGDKPVVAFVDGMMASAAYWIGSAAEVIVTGKMSMIGSIGVLMVHTDCSEQDKMEGLKRTYLTSGKYKAIGNDAEPLSQEARDDIQSKLDYFYLIFVDTVAKQRGVSLKTVRNEMADGKVFIGQQAVEAGLADVVGNIDDAVSLARSMVREDSQLNSKATGGMPSGKEKVAMNIFKKDGKFVTPSTIEDLEAMFPDMVTAIRAQGAASVNTDETKTSAVATERERIMAVVALYLKEDALKVVSSLLESALTAEHIKTIGAVIVGQAQQKAEAVDKVAEDAEKAKMLEAIQAAGAANPGSDNANPIIAQDYIVLVEQYQTENKCSRAEAIRAITISKPDAHKAYIKKINEKKEV